jgi:hypothetical protein
MLNSYEDIQTFRVISTIPSDHEIVVSGSLSPDNLNQVLALIEEHELLGLQIAVPLDNLDIQTRPDGSYSILPKFGPGRKYCRGVGPTINEAIQDWHDKMHFDLFGEKPRLVRA